MFSPASLSGGLVYHSRAWRHRHSHWAPFRKNLQEWLHASPAQSDTLLWIGASGGYTVEPATLAFYQQIVVIEIDPLARWVLKQRFSNSRLTFIGRDLFQFRHEQSDMMDFAHLLNRYPDADIWFSNILGQVPLILKKPDSDATVAALQKIERLVQGRNWLSYHDRLSCHQPDLQIRKTLWQSRGSAAAPALVSHFWQSTHPLEIADHNTSCLENGRPVTYLHWSITRDQHHLIACVRNQNSKIEGLVR
jgi:hypothetical protein